MLGRLYRVFIGVSLLTLCNVAYSAEAIGYVVSWIAANAAAVQLALTVAVSVYGSSQQRKAAKATAQKARDDFNAALQDRTITSVATEAPHRYIYGTAKVGSDVVAIFSSGDKDQYKHLVCVHAAHECNAIREVYVAGKPLGVLDTDGNVTSGDYLHTETHNGNEIHKGLDKYPDGSPFTILEDPLPNTVHVIARLHDGNRTEQISVPFTISGRTISLEKNYADITVSYQFTFKTPRVRVRKHLGTLTDVADASLLSEVSAKWSSTSVLRGLCYTVIRLDLNQTEFQGGIPSIEVLIDGKKLYDPRTGLTQWSQNPALALYDYLTSPICGVPSADIPVAQYITAANVCDETYVMLPLTTKKYTINGAITSDQGQSAILEALAQCMAGSIVSTTWDVSAGKFVAPVMALQQSDIVGSVAITPGMSDADLYNGVRGQFISYENSYVATDFKAYQNPTYLATDGRDLWNNIDFQFTDSLQRVHNLCRIFVEDQRNGFTIKAEFSLKVWGLKVGQRVTFTSNVFGQTAKVYRITDKKFSPNSSVELTLKEDSASIWDYADATVADSTPNTNLPNPFTISPLSSITCESGTDQLIIGGDGSIVSRVYVAWPIATTQAVVNNGLIEIEWQKIEDTAWQKATVSGSETSVFLSPVEDGAYYTVRARTVNPYLNVKSDWVFKVHKVIGKTEPPPDVSSFSITNGVLNWPAIKNTLDLAGYKIKFQYGQNTTWTNAAPLHQGILTDSPYKPSLAPTSVVTIMVKGVDTSGNESLNSANIITNLGDVIVDNLVLTYDDKAAGFPGTKINCTVVSGNLVANETGGSYWGGDTSPNYGPDSTLYWAASTYYGLEYNTQYDVGIAEVGSRLTLLNTIDATSYTLEYRSDTQGLFWGADASNFWAPFTGGIPWVPNSSWGNTYDWATSTNWIGTATLRWNGGASWKDSKGGNPFWAQSGPWQTWSGAIDNIQAGVIQFRVTGQSGAVQAIVSRFILQFDVIDETEELDDIVISASGTRLPIVKTYRSINNIQLTLQDSGSSAVTTMWNDKLKTGPLVYCFNSAGTKVSGVIDARVQGVKG